jgi:hypothetical protein
MDRMDEMWDACSMHPVSLKKLKKKIKKHKNHRHHIYNS